MADLGFVGGYRRRCAPEDGPEGVILHPVTDPGGCGVGIDRIDVGRGNARVLDALGHAPPDRFQVGGYKMMRVRGHGPAATSRVRSRP